MKKVYALFVILSAMYNLNAQSTGNAIVYAEGGEKFIVYLNGEQKNETPKAHVKMTGLTGEFFKIKIDFEDAKLPDFTENFAVEMGSEATYVVKPNKKGGYTCRFQSYVPIGNASASAPAEAVDSKTKQYAVADDEPAVQSDGTVKVNSTMNGTGNVSTTTTTTTTTTPAGGENVNVNMNLGGVQMGVNVNVTGMETTQTTSQTTVTTTSTTTQSHTAPSRPAREEVVYTTGGCTRPMSAADFASAKGSISSKSFEDSKLTTAKQVTKANCLTAMQIKEMMGLFSFEETKLDYAKYAYDYCYDKGNYYKVNDAFTFESSISDLDEYLKSK